MYNISALDVPWLQARTSYLPNEVLWGYRFVNLLTFKHSSAEYKVDYSSFNSVYKTELSPLSQRVKEHLTGGGGGDQDSEEEEAKVPPPPSCNHAPATPLHHARCNNPPYLQCQHSCIIYSTSNRITSLTI